LIDPSEAPAAAPEDSRRSAARSTLVGSGLSILISIAQAFLLIPICLDQVGSRLYGAWLGSTELLIWVQALDLGVPNLVMQRIGAAVGRRDVEEGSRWFVAGLVLLLGHALVLASLALAATPYIARWADVAPDQAELFATCFRIGAVAAAVSLVNAVFHGLARGVQRTALVNGTLVGGSVAGFAVALVLLLRGFGLWALAWGLLARAVIGLSGGIAFAATLDRRWWRVRHRTFGPTLREMTSLVPSLTAGSVGYLAVGFSELALVTTLFGPAAAAMYGLTRRAADAARSILDAFTAAVYGGFAHLVGSDARERARMVAREILVARWAFACLAAAVYAAVNPSLVVLLFGAENWGGHWLTLAFACNLVASGSTYMVNYLYRAAGAVREGALLLAAGGVAHVAATLAGLSLFGVIGAPAAGTLVAIVVFAVNARRFDALLPGERSARPLADRRVAWFGGALVGAGALAGALAGDLSWTGQAALGAALLLLGGATFLWLHPTLRRTLAGALGGRLR
jgi:O-antigen/teichoic acid export membrane protein